VAEFKKNAEQTRSKGGSCEGEKGHHFADGDNWKKEKERSSVFTGKNGV